MSVHGFHEGLPTFSPHQILHDGCAECEESGNDIARAIRSLDKYNFQCAWARATRWNTDGAPDISQAERAVLETLWAVQLKLEARGIPIGELPGEAAI